MSSLTTTDTITLTGSTCYPSNPCVVPLNAGLGSSISYGNGTYTTSSINWGTPTTSFTNNAGAPLLTVSPQGNNIQLDEKATLDVKGIVKINGINLEERLNTIEQVLSIPTRDVEMEEKYPKLKELYEQYMHELAKYRTWDSIKGEE